MTLHLKAFPPGLLAAVLLLIVVLDVGAPSPAAAGPPTPHGQNWQADIAEIGLILDNEKWKLAGRKAEKLADDILGTSWYNRELDVLLAELALYQAVAEAHLDRRDEALWLWHTASNLSPKIRRRDLERYGDKAADLFREFPLRELGELPPGFITRDPGVTRRVSRPELTNDDPPIILNNTAAVRERPGEFHAEVVLDAEGQMHHPVVRSTYLNPIVIYAVLRWLRKLPPATPAKLEGEPFDILFDVNVRFTYERW